MSERAQTRMPGQFTAGLFLAYGLFFVGIGLASLVRHDSSQEHLLILLMMLPAMGVVWLAGQQLFQPKKTAEHILGMPAKHRIRFRTAGRCMGLLAIVLWGISFFGKSALPNHGVARDLGWVGIEAMSLGTLLLHRAGPDRYGVSKAGLSAI